MNVDIQELFNNIMSTRIISSAEKQLVASLLNEESLEDMERALLRRLFYGVERGLVQSAG